MSQLFYIIFISSTELRPLRKVFKLMNATWRCQPMKIRHSRFQPITERAQTITLKTDLEKILGTRPFYPHWVYTCLYCYLLLNSLSKQFSKQLLYNSTAMIAVQSFQLTLFTFPGKKVTLK